MSRTRGSPSARILRGLSPAPPVTHPLLFLSSQVILASVKGGKPPADAGSAADQFMTDHVKAFQADEVGLGGSGGSWGRHLVFHFSQVRILNPKIPTADLYY